MSVLSYAAFAFFPLLIAYAAASDLLTMTIPNLVTVALIAGFAVLAPFALGMDLQTIGLHAAAGAGMLAIGFLLFMFGWIGGGDAKIASAAALWLGVSHTIEFVVWTSIIGGGLSLALLLLKQRLSPALAVRYAWLHRLHDPDTGVPYGIALGAAALLVYPQTVWITLVTG
jgi:prepilin peptidase CpaA